MLSAILAQTAGGEKEASSELGRFLLRIVKGLKGGLEYLKGLSLLTPSSEEYICYVCSSSRTYYCSGCDAQRAEGLKLANGIVEPRPSVRADSRGTVRKELLDIILLAVGSAKTVLEYCAGRGWIVSGWTYGEPTDKNYSEKGKAAGGGARQEGARWYYTEKGAARKAKVKAKKVGFSCEFLRSQKLAVCLSQSTHVYFVLCVRERTAMVVYATLILHVDWAFVNLLTSSSLFLSPPRIQWSEQRSTRSG